MAVEAVVRGQSESIASLHSRSETLLSRQLRAEVVVRAASRAGLQPSSTHLTQVGKSKLTNPPHLMSSSCVDEVTVEFPACSSRFLTSSTLGSCDWDSTVSDNTKISLPVSCQGSLCLLLLCEYVSVERSQACFANQPREVMLSRIETTRVC